jgi:hypothetical protein
MYEVHLEWQTRVCPVGVTSLTRQFRRYFDRFEGRIREPPYAVYDDLAYTQGSPPEVVKSPLEEKNVSKETAAMTGPNLEEYRERLRGFAMDLGTEEGMTEVTFPEEPQADLGELYNFSVLPDTSNYPDSVDNMAEHDLFSNIDPFAGTSTTGFQPVHSNIISPFELGSIPTSSSHHSTGAAGRQQTKEEELPNFLYDEENEMMFGNFDDLFGDMPDMPGLDGVIDQGFLQFLDTN